MKNSLEFFYSENFNDNPKEQFADIIFIQTLTKLFKKYDNLFFYKDKYGEYIKTRIIFEATLVAEEFHKEKLIKEYKIKIVERNSLRFFSLKYTNLKDVENIYEHTIKVIG